MLDQGEIHALREAAERSWSDDTRDEAYRGSERRSEGQCYNTSRWLQDRLGGHVGAVGGHYVWLSPDHSHVLDLTGDQFAKDTLLYKQADHHLFKGVAPIDPSHFDDEGTHRFIARANREYDTLGSPISKIALDYAGDGLPAQEPQATADRDQRYFHHTPGYEEPVGGEYNFVYANGHVEISPFHDHDELAKQAGIDLDSTGPVAVGYASVGNGMANWSVGSNIAAKMIHKILKEYTDHVGWKWGGMTNLDGEPVGAGSEFAPKVTFRWRFANGHLYLGTRDADLIREAATNLDVSHNLSDFPRNNIFGRVEVGAQSANITQLSKGPDVFLSTLEAKNQLSELVIAMQGWASDKGLVLTSGNDNVVKTIEDLDMNNIYTPNPQNLDEHQYFPKVDERQPSGVYKCPDCGILQPTWREYNLHRLEHEPPGEERQEDGGFPENDMSATIPTHFTEQQPQTDAITGAVVFPVASVVEARRAPGFRTFAKAFDFDDDEHRHYVAFQHGCPIGFASVAKNGEILGYSAVTNEAETILINAPKNHFTCVSHRTASGHSDRLLRRAGYVRALGDMWKYAAGSEPKDMIEDDMPFIYDVKNDTITIGHPGQKTSEVPGKFTPGGIVEGTYEPGGKVFIRSMTNMPYTVRHLIQLWYAEHPHLEVKAVSLRDDQGKDTKLAARLHPFAPYHFGAVDPTMPVMTRVAQDPAASLATRALQQAGGRVFAVGGAVRDAVMGKEPKDIDLMVQGIPGEKVQQTLEALPGRVDYTGKDFGVFRFRNTGDEVEIALPRRERSTGDSHKDFDVQADHTLTPEQDLYRRDFTANAMAVDLATGQLLDPYNGVSDIDKGALRTVHEHALAEDPLRVVRALVAHGKHGLHPDEHTRSQMVQNAASLTHLPQERIQAELDKLMASSDPAAAIRLAHETGALKYILPEVDDAFGYDQNNPHHEQELGEHLLSVLDRTAQVSDDPDVRMAALLHDIGKPNSAWVDPETGKNHFYHGPNGEGANHEDLGAQMTKDRLDHLRYPKDRTQRVTDLVQHHMFAPFVTTRGARRFLNKVGDHADDLMDIRWADQGGKSKHPDPDNLSDVDTQRQLLEQTRQEEAPTQLSQLAINGNDLIQMGMKPGPEIGATLKRLTDAVIDDPSLNSRDILLGMV